jgi:hypothetical protein
MNCEQAAEFVSALCDGERIPRAAAEHVGECDVCGTRLKEYAEMGAELRRIASLESTEPIPQIWAKQQRTKSSWWEKGWETMRIPRLAFALLLVAVLVLGSGLVIVKVRAQAQGSVVMVTVRYETGGSVLCPLLSQQQPPWSCQGIADVKFGYLPYKLTLISKDGDRVKLGLRTNFVSFAGAGTQTVSTMGIENQPESEYWFQPGEELKINVPGAGQIKLTGELKDHMPSIIVNNEADGGLDPRPGELRVISPILLRNKKVVMDYAGLSGRTVETDHQVLFYYTQSERLWVLSQSPLEGAVQAHVSQSRISFEMDGASYEFLTAAPVSRSETVWVLHKPDYKPAGVYSRMPDFQGFGGSGILSNLFPQAPAAN